jgi:hypothetical protein
MHHRTEPPPHETTALFPSRPQHTRTLSPPPWTEFDIDPEAALAQLQRCFPSAVMWLGEYTGRYWAMLRDRNQRDHLLDAPTPGELSRMITTFAAQSPAPPVVQRTRSSKATHRTRPGIDASRQARPRRRLLRHALRSFIHRNASRHRAVHTRASAPYYPTKGNR